ncbi:MAG TPA: hypothetical protein VJQ83_09380 [Tepidiformaceae bacterium]|nr:hypothetical protein [Tepidiformaceae bacterium]
MEPFRSIILFAANTVTETTRGGLSPLVLTVLIAAGCILFALVLILGLSDHEKQ